MKGIRIGDLAIAVPVIQGGMGVGISLSGLAAAVANEGGVGVISSAGLGLLYRDFSENFLEASIHGLKEEIRKAREKTKGIIGVNVMVAMTNFVDMIKTSISEKVDIIIAGAGLPLDLPSFLKKESVTKLVPIVSSARAARIICEKWKANYDYLPDAVIVEGPKAGGHLGFREEQIGDENYALEKLVFREKFDKAIQLNEKRPSRNLIGQYFYNIALSETGQLCDRLFHGNQNFLAGSLVLPWGDIHLDRGGYFYYSIGLINEAHRWAYEEMVVYGYRPQNIRMLAKTSLITGDYEMAHKYLNILKRTLFYRKWAKEFEKLANNPSLIASHPELGEKVKLLPPNNFFIQFNEPQNNLPFMLEGNPLNKKAIEYYLAGLLLTKKVEIAVNNVKDLRASGYDHIPRHLEEAILIYYNSMKDFPDLGGLTINRETLARFDQYFAAYVSARQYPDDVFKEKMREQFEDTFWYYFHFE